MKFPFSIVPYETNIRFMKWRYFTFAASIILTVISISLLYYKGLNKGIDFTGGIIMELQSPQNINIKELRSHLHEKGFTGIHLQELLDKKIIMLRLQPKKNVKLAQEVDNIKALLLSKMENLQFLKIDYVGPKVGKELLDKGLYAMLFALVAMMLYIWLRFNWQFGIGAMIALFHDIIMTMGFYVITGYEFDLTAIAAILTIVGYSINDTVVIYDRIRDNLMRHKKMAFIELLNLSINETLSRTIMTVLTTAVVCVALVLFGGRAIESFSATVLFGILFGTYSSICISAPILMYFKIR